MIYRLIILLLFNVFISSQESVFLKKEYCIAVPQEFLKQLSYARREQRNFEDAKTIFSCNNISQQGYNQSSIINTIPKQYKLYLIMAQARDALRNFPAQSANKLPEEIIYYILSYFSYDDVCRLAGKSCKIQAMYHRFTAQDRLSHIEPLKLLEGYYYLSHADLFYLMQHLTLRKNKSGTYALGYHNLFTEIPSSIILYVKTFLEFSKNISFTLFPDSINQKLYMYPTNLIQLSSLEKNKSYQPCVGQLLSSYFSGMSSRSYSYVGEACDRKKIHYFSFNKYCIQDNKILSQKEIKYKAKLLNLKQHSYNEDCMWCNMYKKYTTRCLLRKNTLKLESVDL